MESVFASFYVRAPSLSSLIKDKSYAFILADLQTLKVNKVKKIHRVLQLPFSMVNFFAVPFLGIVLKQICCS
jgi:hypothetical protein